MKREDWERIQQGEFDYHLAKDESRVLELNLPYWRSLLAALPEEVRFGPATRVLDLGCGGCGILLALEQGELVGVDPLMDRYLEKFPFLAARSDIRWVQAAAEELELQERFDVIFSINALDHVYDPARVACQIERLLRPGGHLVLTMNCHNHTWSRAYYAALYRAIDPHHPYQFTPDDVQELFSRLVPVKRRTIDDLWLPHAARYYREVLGRPLEDRRKWLRAAVNPFKWPIGFSKLVLDMPPHPKRAGQRSIYGNYLFVFRAAQG
ncbi:MAG TPA: class I SAM-dependent methyltransferase [Acidobacteriota bacterium]